MKCALCGREGLHLERHHVFGGPFRKKSEKWGMVAYLCPECHRALHFSAKGRELKDRLRKEYQLIFEADHPDVDFIKEFGANYLTDEERAHNEYGGLDL